MNPGKAVKRGARGQGGAAMGAGVTLLSGTAWLERARQRRRGHSVLIGCSAIQWHCLSRWRDGHQLRGRVHLRAPQLSLFLVPYGEGRRRRREQRYRPCEKRPVNRDKAVKRGTRATLYFRHEMVRRRRRGRSVLIGYTASSVASSGPMAG